MSGYDASTNAVRRKVDADAAAARELRRQITAEVLKLVRVSDDRWREPMVYLNDVLEVTKEER